MDVSSIRKASEILRKGGLVAFPTETVYGLGVDARNEKAVGRIFRVKGRPKNHPLIVHLAGVRQIRHWAASVPKEAMTLGKKFWPGPLTLILKKAATVSKTVTGGQNTVGLRVPDHPVALALLRKFKGGIAAPSANRFGRVSPTSAKHVRKDLGEDVDFILDGGRCRVGVESTIVDFSSGEPVILRPGGLTRERLEAALGRRILVRRAGPVRVSGQLRSHYAPTAEVLVVATGDGKVRARELRAKGRRVALLTRKEVAARRLYSSLRRADESGADVIVVPLPSESGLGLAVVDRLRKAAGKR
ncbi:MAG: threonylcarbamoyl-AMP synthase [Planctomycetes bacterium]|nr:threonylcarbamoyl-AMP synthase [Planctomycetota bacterium]